MGGYLADNRVSETERYISNEKLDKITQWLFSLFFHSLVAMGVSVILGFLPEAMVSSFYKDSRIAPFSPVIAITALLLGYFFSGRIAPKAASATWIVGVLWMTYGIHDMIRNWSPVWSTEATRWSYAVANLFMPTSACSGTECLGEFVYTTPFTASLTYAFGSWIRKFRA
jgi:hypothetical protein